MKDPSAIKAAVNSKSLTDLTKTLRELAEGLAYQLKPPYTEVKRYKATEDSERYTIEFSATLHLHYFNAAKRSEGLVFTIDFAGVALTESPSVPIHDLFYAGGVKGFRIFGYGSRWKGRIIPTAEKLAQDLEVDSPTLNEMDLDAFCRALGQSAP
jgi:hypothetical protein